MHATLKDFAANEPIALKIVAIKLTFDLLSNANNYYMVVLIIDN